MDSLKPCPFCGGTDVHPFIGYCADGEGGMFEAIGCACGASAGPRDWNTRPVEDELRARLKYYLKEYTICAVSDTDVYPGGTAMTRKKNHAP